MQLDLFASPVPQKATNSLFLALLPDPETVSWIGKVATGIQSRHSLKGNLRPVDHFHITLHWLGDFHNVPASVVDGVSRACETLAERVVPFEVTLDRITGFGDGRTSLPLVLKGNDKTAPNLPLMEFYQVLASELIKSGAFNPKSPKFNPHLTLLYDRKHLPEEAVEPVSWTAREIVLIHSEKGLTRYHRLGQWSFEANQ